MTGGSNGLTYHVEFYDEAKREYKHLDGSQLIFVKKAIVRLEHYGMIAGAPLHGKLAVYRKLKNKRMGLRIVFGQNASQISIVDIIAIGKRSDSEVYADADTRILKRKRQS